MEYNARQKRAIKNIKYATYNYIGGLENTLQDYSEDSEEYKMAKDILDDHDNLVAEIYDMATHNLYDEGYEGFGAWAYAQVRDLKFCGKAWLIEQIEKRLEKEGY